MYIATRTNSVVGEAYVAAAPFVYSTKAEGKLLFVKDLLDRLNLYKAQLLYDITNSAASFPLYSKMFCEERKDLV